MAVRFSDSEDDNLAPVIPLFGGRQNAPSDGPSEVAAVSGERAPIRAIQEPVDWAAQVHSDAGERGACSTAQFDAAWTRLVKKLRSKPLSEREARRFLSTPADDDALSDELVEAAVEEAQRLGYLDDAKLAEQLVHRARNRKVQGRSAIAQELSTRGIDRAQIDAALEEMPDDEAERAREFARSRARSLVGLEPDVALRRLSGQLARRGFGGLALTIAREALDEARSG